jgi:cytochrome c556
MQRIFVLASVTAGLGAGLLFAQSDSDYQTWMKTVAASNGSLQKGIAAKDSGAVVAEAQKLQDAFKQVGDFWQKRGAADAVTFAKQAETAAAAVSKSAANNNMDQASADAKTLGATCGGCHMAHREKTDAGFKIK